MKSLLISLTLGVVFGLLDILPMVLKKLDAAFIISAFFFWVVVGIATPQASLSAVPWLNGLITAVLLFLPLCPLIYKMDKAALVQVCLTTFVLGAAAGFAAGRLEL